MDATLAPRLRPSLGLLCSEPMRAAFEYALHRFGTIRPQATGDGHAVVIFPGLGSDGRSVAPLREHCQSLGYRAFDWGRGFNTGPRGDPVAWFDELAQDVLCQLGSQEHQATLIGWSLGGIYAREVARNLAPRIRQVITVGTPFNADADHTNVGWLYRLLSGSPATLDAALSRRLRTPPPVSTFSIYSKSDGVVAWQTCRHTRRSRWVQDIEVRGSHIGMTWNPRVLSVVTELLARPVGPSRQRAARQGRAR